METTTETKTILFCAAIFVFAAQYVKPTGKIECAKCFTTVLEICRKLRLVKCTILHPIGRDVGRVRRFRTVSIVFSRDVNAFMAVSGLLMYFYKRFSENFIAFRVPRGSYCRSYFGHRCGFQKRPRAVYARFYCYTIGHF